MRRGHLRDWASDNISPKKTKILKIYVKKIIENDAEISDSEKLRVPRNEFGLFP